MTTHPFTISGAQNAVSAREDIEDALQALASNNSANNAPSTPYANMWWYETDTQLLKIRDEDNLAWINVAYINQSTNKFEVLDETKVVTTSGTQVGILGDQSQLVWETGTGTTESLVSPAKVKAAIEANVEGITHTSGSAPYYGVRAWNGQGQTGNCSISGSIVTFTTAMPHANYAVTTNATSALGTSYAQSKTVNGFQFIAVTSNGNAYASMGEFIVVC